MKVAAISFMLVLAFGFSSCSSDGSGPLGGSLPALGSGDGDTATAAPETEAPGTETPEAPPETAAPETAAPETSPPETAPPQSTPTVDDSGDDDGSSAPWLWILLGGAALAIVAALISSASRRRQATTDHRAVEAQELAEVMAGCQWVHSQSPSLLQISDPVQLRSAWDPMRGQIMGVERSVATAASRPDMYELAGALGSLGVALSTLRLGLEEYVGHAASSDTDPAVVEGAAQTVRIRNEQVAAAAAAVRQLEAGRR